MTSSGGQGRVGGIAVDHLIFGAPSLDVGLGALEDRLGIRPEPGGVHPAFGTRNAIASLGDSMYLEVLAPASPRSSATCLFGLDRLPHARLVTWVARTSDLSGVVERAARVGYRLGPVTEGWRERPDGSRVSWRATRPDAFPEEGTCPFFVDWGDTPHPGEAPGVATLASFRVEHPDAPRIREAFRVIGIDVPVRPGPRPALRATLRAGGRSIELE